VGNSTGVLTYLKNIGSPNSMSLMQDNSIFGNLDFGSYIRPYLADMDGDGDFDLTTADNWYGLNYYENTGSIDNPDWDYDDKMYDGISAGGYRISPVLEDFDGDGDNDLILGHVYGTLTYFENSGGPYDPKWAIAGLPFDKIDVGYRSAPTLGDLNDDGMPDLVIAQWYGQLHYLSKNVFSEFFDLELAFVGDPSPFWTHSGDEPVLLQSVDIMDAVKTELSDKSHETDNFGVDMSTLELMVTVDPIGCDIGLDGIDITYSLSTVTKDFSDNLDTYLSYHLSDMDDEGNITIPITVGSASTGSIDVGDIDIEYDGPPTLVEDIPDVEIEEESSNDTLVDLHAYFDDVETRDDMIDYRLEWTSFNQSMVAVTIFNNRYLSVDAMNPEASANWTGSGTVVVSAEDILGNKVVSNEFTTTSTITTLMPRTWTRKTTWSILSRSLPRQ
jgi:hypothetical protein